MLSAPSGEQTVTALLTLIIVRDVNVMCFQLNFVIWPLPFSPVLEVGHQSFPLWPFYPRVYLQSPLRFLHLLFFSKVFQYAGFG